MKNNNTTLFGLLLGLLVNLSSAQLSEAQVDSGWVELFNGKDLDGLYTFLKGEGKDKDPTGIFSADKGEIKVEKGTAGYVATSKVYNYYHVRADFKFEGLDNLNSNAGLLYHIREDVPKRGDVWPPSIESQMQKRGTGEIWTIFGVRVKTTTANKNELCKYDPNGEEIDHGAGKGSNVGRQCLGSSNPYKDGEWNSMLVKVYGSDSSVQFVNGTQTFKAWNMRVADNFTDMSDPLNKGTIGLQSEGAAISYKNFHIMELDSKTLKPINAKTSVIKKASPKLAIKFQSNKLDMILLIDYKGNHYDLTGRQFN